MAQSTCSGQIKDNRELSEYLGLTCQQLAYFAYSKRSHHYATWRIPKKNGGIRTIEAPLGALKTIQRKLIPLFESLYCELPCVYGFIHNKSIANNAQRHIQKKMIMSIDLVDFFPSITSGRIHELLIKGFHFEDEVANTLTNIVCHNGHLPQGAPTSPILSNMVCFKMDRGFLSLAAKHKFTYTRYADDLTFSVTSSYAASFLFDKGKWGIDGINDEIRRIVAANGFVINPEKIMIAGRGTRQVVNSVLVNKKCNMNRETYRSFRALFHIWKTQGYNAALLAYIRANPQYLSRLFVDDEFIEKNKFISHIRGRLDFLTMVITVSGHTTQPLEKLWASFHDITKEKVPFVSPDRYVLRLDWVYDTVSGDVNAATGSAFSVNGFLVTCEHCLPPAFDVDLEGKSPAISFCQEKGEESLSVDEPCFKRVACFDLAYAFVEAPSFIPISRVANSYWPQNGESVIAAGYPGGKGSYVIEAKVINRLANGCIRVDRPFIVGMSGGPVFNSRRELIGIVVKGSDESSYSREGEFLLLAAISEYLPQTLFA